MFDSKRFYRGPNFLLCLAEQTFLLIGLRYAFVQRGSLPAPAILAGIFLFSVLLWRRGLRADAFPQTHLYMAIQTAVEEAEPYANQLSAAWVKLEF
ncbi:MAG: hypothetical protein OXG26_16965 [Caldilineaceae bacterium]|nr:hypothetical protein [Caldilineaceae bacterium]